MTEKESFQALIQRVRSGDAEAATELVKKYEPGIRRAVRIRLTNQRLQRVLDSMDICQSVMANFFVRAAAGQFELDEPGQLLKLLATMARNKLRDQVRKQSAGRRDSRRVQSGPEALEAIADPNDSPSQIVAGRELIENMRLQLSERERYLADQRTMGQDWSAIAADLGESPEALRKQLARAIDRVARQLGIDEVGDE
jgi:RNA polymerase sigma-70 factor (ECF subfamily)